MLERGRGKIVNNASISGYAWFPATTTYAAAKTGVVAFSESLRRELRRHRRERAPPRDAGRGHGHARRHATRSTGATWTPTPGATQPARSGRRRSCAAIERDDHVLGPGGQAGARQARLARARLPARRRLAGGCSPRELRGRPASAQQRLDVADPALAEAALAPGEVELAQPPEAPVGAEPLRLVGRRQRSSRASGAAWAGSSAVMSSTSRIRMSVGPRGRAPDHLAATAGSRPGRSASFDEAARRLLELVGAVVDRDRLEQHQPVRLEQLASSARRRCRSTASRPPRSSRSRRACRSARAGRGSPRAAPCTRSVEPGLAHALAWPRRAARARSWWWSRGSRSRPRRGGRATPQPVPISSRWSSGVELELAADQVELRLLRLAQATSPASSNTAQE